MFVLSQATFQRIECLRHAVFRVADRVGRRARCALDRFARLAVAAAHAARIVDAGAENDAKAVLAGRAVAAADVALVVVVRAVAHTLAVGAGGAVAAANVAAVIGGRAVGNALAVEARLTVAVAHVAHVIRGCAEYCAEAVGAVVFAVAHAALIVHGRAVGNALAVLARRAIAAAHVARVVHVRAVGNLSTVQAGRAIAAANVADIDGKARERHARQLTAGGEKVLANTIVLERAHERGNVEEPLLGAVQLDRLEAGGSEQSVEVGDRPLQIGLADAGRRVVVLGRGRLQHLVGGLVLEALVELVEAGAVVQIDAKAGGVKHLAADVAREALRRCGALRRVADDEIKDAIGALAADGTNVERDDGSLGVAKVGQIGATTVGEEVVRRVRVVVALGVTAHTKAIDADVQSVEAVVKREANIFDIPAGNGQANVGKARWQTDVLFTYYIVFFKKKHVSVVLR
jgi:hypothetical protein